jgi:hypothetical protein
MVAASIIRVVALIEAISTSEVLVSFYMAKHPTRQPSSYSVRFQVLMAAGMKVTAFWDIAPCSLIEVERRFRGVYCLHHQGVE